MVRFGWVLIAAGLMVMAVIVFKFYLAMVIDPTLNAPLWGFLMVAGFGVGVAVSVVGAAIVAKAHGIRTPPV